MADLSTVAGGYATVAAVLAGFAFSGLVLLLTVRMVPEAARQLSTSYPAAVRALLAAFISLTLVALNYAYLTGLGSVDGPAASHSVLYGFAFAVAGMQLTYAVLLVMATAETSGVATRISADGVFGTFQKVIVGVLAPFIVLSLFAGATEYRQLHPGEEQSLDVVLATVCVAWFVIAAVWGLRRGWRQRPSTFRRVRPMAGGATAVVALMTMLTFTGSFNSDDPCATADLSVLVVTATIAGIAILALTIAVARFHVPDTNARS